MPELNYSDEIKDIISDDENWEDEVYGITDDDDEVLAVGKPLAALDNDTAYIRLIRFMGKADDFFENALEIFKAEGKKNLVLDLRGNGGGDMKILQEIAKMYILWHTK